LKKPELTERQQELLDYIIENVKARGCAPTHREMAEFQGIALKAVVDRVHALEKKGYVRREPGIARGLKVLQ